MSVRIRVDRRLGLPATTLALLGRTIERAGRALGWDREACGQIGVQVVGDREMEEIHERHLGYRKATDVLSFAGGEEGGPPGDLVLNADAIARQAAGPNHEDWLEEAAQLSVHGLVHLLGHDHATRLEGRRMLALERKAARAAGIALPSRQYP